ncbi:CheR family methyltransferase [Pseudochryseolinea flava]|uniref:Protein-glutamate O-methyltransferase CheR n=1 Tax=Pseudochryseolinea flava TaxID=2059302 RepID=A0A364Y2L5_9BACT|nr:protein-glutamate O-methyltransferase CheR [Pseudochryseolinea flava]RAW01020.1 protein-glutamate O-methyltransferase CheR [Pseudochryseolinea flava]
MYTPVDVSEEEMNSLTQSILTRYGIDFTCYEPKSLRRRIVRVLSVFNFTSIHELWVRLLRDPNFIFSFMNEISVGMTSMFRDPILWKNLRKRMTHDYSASDSVSIWHAGCSTGEEVYSMGILLKEAQLNQKTKAIATDINQDAIATAKQGIYHKIKMIENENNYRQYNAYSDFSKYYTTQGKDATMDASLIDHVSFSYHNLISDRTIGQYDMILCRNVMIYFDNKAKAKLLEKFYNALKPGGYFIIGFYDTMLPVINQNEFKIVDEEAKIFMKQ